MKYQIAVWLLVFSVVTMFGASMPLHGIAEEDLEAEDVEEPEDEEIGTYADIEQSAQPPSGAIVKDLKVKCKQLRDYPRLAKKAGCKKKKKGGASAEARITGDCGDSWIEIRDVKNNGGRAEIKYGWISILGPAKQAVSTVTWTNYTAGVGSYWYMDWAPGIYWTGSGRDIREVTTGSGVVGALQTGEIVLAEAPITCIIAAPFESTTIT